VDEWWLNDTQVGTWTVRDNLTYVKVRLMINTQSRRILIPHQVLGSSHMVGYDVPDVTNDMIARFMKVDFSLLPGNEAASKSRIGSTLRPAIGVLGAASGGVPLFKGGSSSYEG
jgi:carboxypeptidase D